MALVRDGLAWLLRALPPVRGKGRLGGFITDRLTDPSSDESCLVRFRMRDGTTMRVDLRSPMERNAFFTGEYDGATIERLKSFLGRGSVVLDIGANVGFYAVALGAHLRALGGGRVYAFEPVPQNFARLTEVIADNRLADVVLPQRLALSAEEGEIALRLTEDPRAQTGNAMVVVPAPSGPPASGRVVRARGVRLDDVALQLGIDRIDLIKLDIEGAEHLALLGARGLISAHSPIVYGEFDPGYMAAHGHGFRDVARLFAPLGYRFFRERRPGTFEEVFEPGDGLSNVLIVPPWLIVPP